MFEMLGGSYHLFLNAYSHLFSTEGSCRPPPPHHWTQAMCRRGRPHPVARRRRALHRAGGAPVAGSRGSPRRSHGGHRACLGERDTPVSLVPCRGQAPSGRGGVICDAPCSIVKICKTLQTVTTSKIVKTHSCKELYILMKDSFIVQLSRVFEIMYVSRSRSSGPGSARSTTRSRRCGPWPRPSHPRRSSRPRSPRSSRRPRPRKSMILFMLLSRPRPRMGPRPRRRP